MKQFTTATTQRNQVTIPAEVRRVLGLKPRDLITFTIEDGGTVRMAAVPFSLESAYGSVKPSTGPEDFDGVARDAKDTNAEDTVRELSESRGSRK